MEIVPPARVLVTGASGYLAGFVAPRLRSAGYRLRGFDRVPPPPDRGYAEFVLGDITRFSDVREAVEGQDAVVHLVAIVRDKLEQPLERFVDVMVKGTWFLAEAAAQAGIKRLVNVSSIVAIGVPPARDAPLRESHPPLLGGTGLYYQLSKWLAEEIGRAYAQDRGLSVINVRPGVIEGDGANPGPSLPREPLRLWFMYVAPDDVAQALEGALRVSRPSQSAYFVVADHPESAYDISAAKRDLGYAPRRNWKQLRCYTEEPE
ncbi:MAG: NAD(P)-dependent oxidoreductase [Dehalococcoidales bacterium]|nr:NAD(P)-dependent oxidoreductase [Dehalococcoidales bacterium]